MLPTPSNVRSRYTSKQLQQEKGMARLETAMQDSAVRFKRLPTRVKFCLGLSLIISIVFYGVIFRMLFKNDLLDENFLETEKCPACFGMNGCGQLFYGRAKLTGLSKIRFLDFTNLKNVHFADHEDVPNGVVLKKLAHDRELQEIDDKICSDGNRLSGCDVARVIYITNTAQTLKTKALQPKLLKESAAMFTCSSYRLLDRMWQYYKERTKKDEIFFRDKVQLWYITLVNPEPLLLQTFPAKEGWPFPEYFGACGRFVVVENSGKPLYEFYDAPFEKRADIAYQVMQIAEKFTSNDLKFSLYWTDLNSENLSVDNSGKVKVIDLENIIVVDVMAIEAVKPNGYDLFLESKFDDCDGKNCLGFQTEMLCTRVNSDHNYYAACRNILSKYANEPGRPGGLLHDMPEHARDYWDLENLLNECARPHTEQGRIKVKGKLMTALDNLRKSGIDKDVNILDEALKDKHDKRYWKELQQEQQNND